MFPALMLLSPVPAVAVPLTLPERGLAAPEEAQVQELDAPQPQTQRGGRQPRG